MGGAVGSDGDETSDDGSGVGDHSDHTAVAASTTTTRTRRATTHERPTSERFIAVSRYRSTVRRCIEIRRDSSKTTTETVGAVSGDRGSSGHHCSDSLYVRLIRP
ncbi:hypothetical protein HSB1_45300 [Halogranum salarium B-1]|uniref:Uncharacterized protein n=1 Tax=Halogranum salarium B-1 TaxID=1210908 RepID=J3JD35_9EURY|nr:hypothetical protein HSB1_45300 [Halogranum salarium B-1]